jgi:large subunit ribosomal protein L28
MGAAVADWGGRDILRVSALLAGPTWFAVAVDKVIDMAQVCEVCGKRSQVGNAIETRGKAKYLGGVGTKITGITRRRFKPNLQRVKVSTDRGGVRTMRVCTQCLRGGAVRKAIKRRPFKLPPSAGKAKAS